MLNQSVCHSPGGGLRKSPRRSRDARTPRHSRDARTHGTRDTFHGAPVTHALLL